MGVEFRLLGEVEVWADGQPVEVGHARQRGVLALLAVEANRLVSVEQLVARVWGDRAPRRARETLYNYLSRLRHAVGPLSGVGLGRRPGGYVLTVDPLAVDVHRFAHLVSQARAAGDEDQARGLLQQALGLWRGEPLAGLDTPWVTGWREALERDRFAAELDYTDLRLRRGEHGWLVGELTARAEVFALDERVAGQLMLALYRCGRQAEALEHFQHLRARLAEELGIDPSPDLWRLYEQILTTDPALTAPIMASSRSGSVSLSVPRQLPAHSPHFVGRTAQLRQLSTLLEQAAGGGSAGAVVITAIEGTAGIGKTALALHWAHQNAERFPDGQLYVNLRGFDPTNVPLHPAEALGGFFDALGIPAERIPVGVEAQAGLYRSLLADRRMLVVLDNARDTEQVSPLLPAGPHCLVVITSRNQHTSLITHHGAHPITLDVLSPHEARELLACHLGPDRLSADPEAVTTLIEYCARLPLALGIVAARAATHPGFELRVLAKELADERTRLDALDTGEPTTSVHTVFSWSYQQLSPPAARMFRLLGLHPGPDLALPAATQLAGLSPRQARQGLSELTRAHLLTEPTPGRYSFHDLLRAYATHLTLAPDSPDDTHAALTRLFDHYLHTATAAMDTLYPLQQQHRPPIPPPAMPAPLITNPASARHWLETERVNLIAIVAYCSAHGWHTHTIQLANTVFLRLFELGGPYRGGPSPVTLTLLTHVRHAARHVGDSKSEAVALIYLGLTFWHQGHYQQAAEHYQQALAICRDIGFPVGEATALTNFGFVFWQQGRYQQATECYQQALTICRDIGDRTIEALALSYLGTVFWRQGRYQEAAEHHQHALTISRGTGHRIVEFHAFTSLGLVFWQQGRYQEAAEHHQDALAVCHDIGYRSGEVFALINLGLVFWRQGRYQEAAEQHHNALAICRGTGYRTIEAFALTSLGLVFLEQGRYQESTEQHHNALAICREIDFRAIEALILTSLGLVFWRQGRYQEATAHHRQALAICREIGDRASEPQILNGLGETHYATGEFEQARIQHTAALTLATELGDRYEQARAHHGLAHTHHTTGDLDQAHHHAHQALTLFTALGVPLPMTPASELPQWGQVSRYGSPGT